MYVISLSQVRHLILIHCLIFEPVYYEFFLSE